MHIKSSDWLLHGHQHDRAYDTVVLHIVYQDDQPVYRTNGSLIPTLVLNGLFAEELLNSYQAMIYAPYQFPCQMQIRDVDPLIIESVLSRMMLERFEQKEAELLDKLSHYKGDWEASFYYFVARNFGFKVNAPGFELIAGSLPRQLFDKHKDNAGQIEALLFGQAGFLTQAHTDPYPIALQAEYTFLKKKYQLVPLDPSVWKFLRMRPQNFPTVRLAQFAALLFHAEHLFSRILDLKDLNEVYRLFKSLPVNEYWLKHYHFNKATEKVNLQLGLPSIQNIIINTICLFLFAYGKYSGRPELIDRAFHFLEELPCEQNSVIYPYIGSGVKPRNAFMSQALLQLNKYYCVQKKCLNCGIGVKILKK